jgi:hypothetical protein
MAYLRYRQAEAGNYPSVFRANRHKESFQVRFFNQSQKLKDLHQQIEDEANADWEDKQIEYSNKMALFRRLDPISRQACDVVYTPDGSHNARACKKCCAKKDLAENKIFVLEDPFPQDLAATATIVFELQAPQGFRFWREAVTFFKRRVLQSAYVREDPPKTPKRYTLRKFRPLRSHFRGHPKTKTDGSPC